MDTLRTLGLAVALGLSSAALAQAQTPPDPAGTQASPPDATAVEAPKLVGLQVVSASGEQLGSVTDVMADTATGAPIYVVIAPVPATGGGASTAIPYGTATAMIRNETLVMERAKLDGAPKVGQDKLKDPNSTAWQEESDRYWGNSRAASKDPAKPKG